MRLKAVLDRGFSYVQEDRPTQPNECCPTIVARDLYPEHAQLFAAAPELLEACEAALSQMDPCGDNDPGEVDFKTCQVLRSVIAKAKGKEVA